MGEKNIQMLMNVSTVVLVAALVAAFTAVIRAALAVH